MMLLSSVTMIFSGIKITMTHSLRRNGKSVKLQQFDAIITRRGFEKELVQHVTRIFNKVSMTVFGRVLKQSANLPFCEYSCFIDQNVS